MFFVKFIAYLGRAFTTQSRFFKTNMLHYAGGVTIIAIVTASTAGYGDIVPKTGMGRITGVWLMILGVACTTAFTSIIAGRIMARSGEQKQQNPHVATVQRQLDRFESLSDEEVEDICTVLQSPRRGGKTAAEAQTEEKAESALPETALDRKSQSFKIVRRVRARFTPLLHAEDKPTELIEESKGKDAGK